MLVSLGMVHHARPPDPSTWQCGLEAPVAPLGPKELLAPLTVQCHNSSHLNSCNHFGLVPVNLCLADLASKLVLGLDESA